MELQQITYDISRLYLQDRKGTLTKETYDLLHGWIRARDLPSLAACATDDRLDVTSLSASQTIRQVAAFFKKNVCFTDPLVARLAALLSFEKGEELCQETNERLDTFYSKHHDKSIHDDFRSEVEACQKYIANVLGSFSDFLGELPKLIYVTAGATATHSRRLSIPFLKVSKRLVCTPGAYPYIAALSDYYGYGEIQGKLITENRVTFVPKSWKTERTIACEPTGNMCLQLAFDKYAKRRLRRAGLDLSDQTKNQELAKEGSIDGKYSTIDLSMASDTLAYNTVALLFPEKWFQYLRSVRSQFYTMYPGNKETYSKFSSMGNGSTFPIETLVFAAACRAVGSSSFSVYGDDIIIEQNNVERLLALLAYLGFVPNTDKSFTEGPFRESCGKDWYKGFDITPFYIRELDRRKATQCHLANGLMRICKPNGSLFAYLVDFIKENKLPLVPFNEDSMSGVWISPNAAYQRKLIRTANRGRKAWIPMFKGYKPASSKIHSNDSRSLFLWYLKAIGAGDPMFPRGFSSPVDMGYNYPSRIRNSRESSWYTAPRHKYVRKWVHWIPVAGAPDNLYWLTESLVPEVS